MWIFSILDSSMTTLKISKASPITQPKIKTVGAYLATCRKLIVTRESNVSLTADSSLGAIWNILLLQSFIKLTIFLSLSSGTACLLIYVPSKEKNLIFFAFGLSISFHQDHVQTMFVSRIALKYIAQMSRNSMYDRVFLQVSQFVL